MSRVFENLSKKISNTLDTAQKELRQSMAHSLSAAATTLSSTSKPPPAGTKTRLFSTILERSQRIRDTIIDRRDPSRAANGRAGAEAGALATDSPIQRDQVQEKLAIFARLEKEFCDLIEAYEIMLVERQHLEELLVGQGELESLDDLELVGQYYKALQDTSQISKVEIARLTQELERLQQNVALQEEGASGKTSVVPSNSLEPNVPPSTYDVSRNSSVQTLTSEKSALSSLVQEQNNTISSLESQKMALETKVSYLQKQLSDQEGLRSRLHELSSANQDEVAAARAEAQKCQLKLDLAESALAQTRRTLEVCQAELQVLKNANCNEQQSLVKETYRLEEMLKLTRTLLREEQQRCQDVQDQLTQAQTQVEGLQQQLASKELDFLRTLRATSIDSFKPPSGKDGASEGAITAESQRSLITVASRRSSADASMEQSLKALKSECERLAIENSQLRMSSQTEYLRNIILRYLQLPEQRRSLMPVIASVLRFSEAELKTIKK